MKPFTFNIRTHFIVAKRTEFLKKDLNVSVSAINVLSQRQMPLKTRAEGNSYVLGRMPQRSSLSVAVAKAVAMATSIDEGSL